MFLSRQLKTKGGLGQYWQRRGHGVEMGTVIVGLGWRWKQYCGDADNIFYAVPLSSRNL